jgi:hypothetical protein
VSDQERRARSYCESIGADPDELVLGVLSLDQPALSERVFFTQSRWRWYVGAI